MGQSPSCMTFPLETCLNEAKDTIGGDWQGARSKQGYGPGKHMGCPDRSLNHSSSKSHLRDAKDMKGLEEGWPCQETLQRRFNWKPIFLELLIIILNYGVPQSKLACFISKQYSKHALKGSLV